MDAVEFLKEQYRMCEALNSYCDECGLSYVNNKTDRVCGDFIKRYPEETVAIVEKWVNREYRQLFTKNQFHQAMKHAKVNNLSTVTYEQVLSIFNSYLLFNGRK